jgi:hypothetical protein
VDIVARIIGGLLLAGGALLLFIGIGDSAAGVSAIAESHATIASGITAVGFGGVLLTLGSILDFIRRGPPPKELETPIVPAHKLNEKVPNDPAGRTWAQLIEETKK